MVIDTYKKKYHLAIVSVLVLLVIAYMGPVSQTLELLRKKQDLLLAIDKFGQAPQRIAIVKKQLNDLDVAVGFNDTLKFDQQDLFVKMAEFAEKHFVKIREMPESHSYKELNLLVETQVFILEGRFVDLVRLIYDMESSLPLFSIGSLRFNRIKDKETERHRLIVELYIQGIRKL
jgi:hypothetical protein